MTDPDHWSVPIIPGRPTVSAAADPALAPLHLPQPTPSKGPRWVVPLFVMLAVLLVAMGTTIVLLLLNRPGGQPATAGPTTPPAAPVTTKPFVAPLNLSGTLILIDDSSHWKVGKDCEGDNGFDDIHVGTQVVVLGASGQILADGELIGGTGKRSGTHIGCTFGFLVIGVTAGEGHYTLRIGHRDRVVSEDEFASDLELSLGE